MRESFKPENDPAPTGLAAQINAQARELAESAGGFAEERRRSAILARVLIDLNAGRSLPDVIRAAVTSTAEALGGDDGALFLFEADGRHLRGAFELWARERVGAVFDLDQLPGAKRAVDSKGAVFSTAADVGGGDAAWLRQQGIFACIAAPLLVSGRRLGLIYVNFRRQGHCPPAEDIAFADVVAAQCALAIDRAQALADAENQRARVEQLIQTSNVIVLGLDEAGNVRVFNEAAEQITGYTSQELEGQSWFGVIVPRERYPHAWRAFSEARAGGQLAKTFENPILTKSGEERYIVWQNSVLRERGEFSGTISFGIDITERKRAEQQRERLMSQLQEANQRLGVISTESKHSAAIAQRRAAELQGILDNMLDGVFVCDAHGRITLANMAALRLLGLTSLADVQRPFSEVPELLRMRYLDGSPVPPEALPLARALAGETCDMEAEIIRNVKTGRDIYIRCSAGPIEDEAGQIVGAVAVAKDVTELAELDRLKDEFISVAAHELKTPVAIMKGYAQALLRAREDIPPPRRRMLEAINRGADRIDAVVKDLLDISKLHAGRLELAVERIDLPALVTEVTDRLQLTSPRHNVRVVSAEPVVVHGDRDRLEQVLMNLLDNAVKYSPKGGDVDVTVAVRDREAVVSVRDYGVGIAKDKQARVFQRFYSAHAGTPYDYGGMGVGLYISREIVRRHGGRLWFDSTAGKGSTFYFSLPLR